MSIGLVLWQAIDEYARRDRRYGGAVDAVLGVPDASPPARSGDPG